MALEREPPSENGFMHIRELTKDSNGSWRASMPDSISGEKQRPIGQKGDSRNSCFQTIFPCTVKLCAEEPARVIEHESKHHIPAEPPTAFCFICFRRPPRLASNQILK